MNFLRTVLALCTSFAAYREVRDRSPTASVFHLLKLMLLLALVLTLSFIPVALRGVDTLADRFDRDRPEFAIEAGRVVTAVTEPRYWGNAELRFGLVPGAQTNTAAPRAFSGMVFHEDRFVFWTTMTNVTPAQVREFAQPLAGLPDGRVEGDYFRRLLRWSLPIMLPVGWVVGTLVGTLMGLLQAYTFSLIGAFMERSLPGRFSFTQLLNVTLHAITPAGILVTVYAALRLPGLDLWLVYLIAFGVFLLGATNACRERQPEPEPPASD